MQGIIEIWHPIKNYEGLYEVSNLGRIKSCVKKYGVNYSCIRAEMIMRDSDNGTGYRKIVLCKNSKRVTMYVHIIVASIFIPNPENKKEVNHKDADKKNNCFDNLEWVTIKENKDHAVKNGLVKSGVTHYLSKPIIQMDLHGNEIRKWESSCAVTRELKWASENIRNCCKGKFKTAYGFKWKHAS